MASLSPEGASQRWVPQGMGHRVDDDYIGMIMCCWFNKSWWRRNEYRSGQREWVNIGLFGNVLLTLSLDASNSTHWCFQKTLSGEQIISFIAGYHDRSDVNYSCSQIFHCAANRVLFRTYAFAKHFWMARYSIRVSMTSPCACLRHPFARFPIRIGKPHRKEENLICLRKILYNSMMLQARCNSSFLLHSSTSSSTNHFLFRVCNVIFDTDCDPSNV